MENTEKSAKQLLEELDNAIASSENPRYIELNIHDAVAMSANMGEADPPKTEYEDIEEEDEGEDIESEDDDEYNILNNY